MPHSARCRCWRLGRSGLPATIETSHTPQPTRMKHHRPNPEDIAAVAAYDPTAYPAVGVAVDVVVLTIRDGELCVVLIRRGEAPCAGAWALPGGFCRPDEDALGAAAREISEEAGLDASRLHLEQLATFTDPDRDPRARVVSVAHLGFVPELDHPNAGSDASDVAIWSIKQLIDEQVPLPFDHGHILATGISHCDVLHVVVCDDHRSVPAADVRAGWIRAVTERDGSAGRVVVHVVDDICTWHGADPCPPDCSTAWVEYLRRHGIGSVDVVVSSEPYGDLFAAAWGPACDHVVVDADRVAHPVSGTAVRDDPARHWETLSEVVRVGLVRRVVVVGAESTGTTTLAEALADALATVWVPEYGRAHSETLAAQAGGIGQVVWTDDDFDEIVEGQRRLERAGAADVPGTFDPAAGPVLVCDTDVLATAVWHERYGPPGTVAEDTPGWHSHLDDPGWVYVLTGDEIPFVQDGLRDGEHLRHGMHRRFRELLACSGVPWIEVFGSVSERVGVAVGFVSAVAASEPWLSYRP